MCEGYQEVGGEVVEDDSVLCNKSWYQCQWVCVRGEGQEREGKRLLREAKRPACA
jgi:hypothetical protein